MTKTKENVEMKNPFDPEAIEKSLAGFMNAISKPEPEQIEKAKKTAMTIGISVGAGLLIGYLIGKKR